MIYFGRIGPNYILIQIQRVETCCQSLLGHSKAKNIISHYNSFKFAVKMFITVDVLIVGPERRIWEKIFLSEISVERQKIHYCCWIPHAFDVNHFASANSAF